MFRYRHGDVELKADEGAEILGHAFTDVLTFLLS